VKILSLATTHPRWSGDGEPGYVLSVNRELVRRGHEVTTLLPHAPGAKRSEVVGGVRIRRFRYFLPPAYQRLCYDGGILPNLRRSWWARVNLPAFLIVQAGTVGREIRAGGYDVVHCHWLISNGFMASLTTRSSRVPLVVTAHGSDVFVDNVLFRVADRFVLRRCDACTVNSHRSGERVVDIFAESPIEVVPMGIYPDRFGPHHRSTAVRALMGGGRPQLLYVGRFSQHKGVPDLLRAMRLLESELPGARLALVGFGPEEDFIRRLVGDLGLESQVRLLGRASHDEIPGYMASADLVVLPSIKVEGLGVVLLEALASGTAVVGTDVGGIPDIIRHEETGLICRSQDPEHMAAACLRLVRDDDLRRRTTAVGRRLVEEKFCWSRIASRLEAVFERCIRRAPSGRPSAGRS